MKVQYRGWRVADTDYPPGTYYQASFSQAAFTGQHTQHKGHNMRRIKYKRTTDHTDLYLTAGFIICIVIGVLMAISIA